MLPTFMILGAAKAGTTSLHYYLSQHRDIYMSHPKEPPFFQREYELGPEYYEKTYFHGWTNEKHVGDAAHRNLFLPYIPARIAETVPNARFIVITRNPVERSFSHFWHEYSRGDQKRSFEECLERDVERLKNGPSFENPQVFVNALDEYDSTPDVPTYLDSGYYGEQIQRYIDLFGAERVKILFFEDLVNKTEYMLNQVFQFLELESIPIKNLSPQNPPVPRLVSDFYRLIGKIPVTSRISPSLRNGVKRFINNKFKRNKPTMKLETRKWLIKHYIPHNRRLEEMTSRDLSHWNS